MLYANASVVVARYFSWAERLVITTNRLIFTLKTGHHFRFCQLELDAFIWAYFLRFCLPWRQIVFKFYEVYANHIAYYILFGMCDCVCDVQKHPQESSLLVKFFRIFCWLWANFTRRKAHGNHRHFWRLLGFADSASFPTKRNHFLTSIAKRSAHILLSDPT